MVDDLSEEYARAAKQELSEFLDGLHDRPTFDDRVTEQDYRDRLGPSFLEDPEYRSTIWEKSVDQIEILRMIETAKDALEDEAADDLAELLDAIFARHPLLRRASADTRDTRERLLGMVDALRRPDIEILWTPDRRILVPELIISASDELFQAIRGDPHRLFDLSPRQFEELVAEIFRRTGWEVQLTARTRDGGRDVVALRNDMDIWIKLIIECKRFGPSKRVGLAYVQRLLGVKIAEAANKALLVTTATFTRPARKFESKHFWDLELKDRAAVLGWIGDVSR